MMGRRLCDPILQSDISHWPFSNVEGSNGRPEIQVTYRGRYGATVQPAVLTGQCSDVVL